jgi:tetratricopeptide (TPR) repeat protein
VALDTIPEGQTEDDFAKSEGATDDQALLDALLAEIPEGEQYDPIRNALKRVAATFPGELPEITAVRVAGWVEEVDNGGGRDADQIRDDIFEFVVGIQEIQDTLGVDEATAEALIAGSNDDGIDFHTFLQGQGAQPEQLGIMDGATGWYYDPETELYYVEYTLPESGMTLLFEASAEDMDSLWGEGVRPAVTDIDFNSYVRTEGVVFAGGIGEVEGEGSFQENVDSTIALALDEGTLPEWARGNAAAEELLFISISENKGSDWLITNLAKLPEFQERFPGIDTFMENGLTVPEAIAAHLDFETALKELERANGGDPDRITPQVAADIAAQGYSVTDVARAYSIFKRMEDFAPALEAFNEILVASGLDPISSTEEMYAFLAGEAPADFYEIYEASSLREAAEAAGVGSIFDADDAIEAAAAMPFVMSPQQIGPAMIRAAQDILRFRHELNLEGIGFDADDLVDISLGIAPRSGRSQAEIAGVMDSLIKQAQGFLDQSVQPFFGFTKTGQPQARSFGELRQQSV